MLKQVLQYVTILILLEIILQHYKEHIKRCVDNGYNPYFIGNHSATNIGIYQKEEEICYNPYFIGNHSATEITDRESPRIISYNPYFIGNHSAT